MDDREEFELLLQFVYNYYNPQQQQCGGLKSLGCMLRSLGQVWRYSEILNASQQLGIAAAAADAQKDRTRGISFAAFRLLALQKREEEFKSLRCTQNKQTRIKQREKKQTTAATTASRSSSSSSKGSSIEKKPLQQQQQKEQQKQQQQEQHQEQHQDQQDEEQQQQVLPRLSEEEIKELRVCYSLLSSEANSLCPVSELIHIISVLGEKISPEDIQKILVVEGLADKQFLSFDDFLRLFARL